MTFMTSVLLLLSVTFATCGCLTLSGYWIDTIRSVIVVPYSGSGTRQIRPSVSLSSGSPVASASSKPSTSIVITGSLWISSCSIAHRRSSSLLSMLVSVSTFAMIPYW